MRQRETGFTLIELMIAVVIISILAAIAIQSYGAQQKRARRSDAQAALMSLANALERYYSRNNSYLGAGTGANTNGDLNSAGAPATTLHPASTPIGGTVTYYNLTIFDSTASNYTLRATPTGVQAGNGYLELTSTGIRRWDRNNDTDTNDVVDGKSEQSWD